MSGPSGSGDGGSGFGDVVVAVYRRAVMDAEQVDVRGDTGVALLDDRRPGSLAGHGDGVAEEHRDVHGVVRMAGRGPVDEVARYQVAPGHLVHDRSRRLRVGVAGSEDVLPRGDGVEPADQPRAVQADRLVGRAGLYSARVSAASAVSRP